MKVVESSAGLVRSHAAGRALRVDLAARVRAGLPVREFDDLRQLLCLTVDRLAAMVGVSIATLSRRRRTGQPLDPDQSDRLLRYAHLFRLALELHDGDAEAARAWLGGPARALDGETPLARANTEIGAREVEDLIGRIEHGVYI